MTDRLFPTLAFAAALGSGLTAGVFFAFSAFVMRALRRLPDATGMAAMQSINVAVLNPAFLGVFLGTAAVSAVAAAGAVLRWDRPASGWLLAGGGLYLAGTFGVTVAFNVPLNNALAAVAPDAPDAPARWAAYAGRWTAWNHVRKAAALAAAAAFTAAVADLRP